MRRGLNPATFSHSQTIHWNKFKQDTRSKTLVATQSISHTVSRSVGNIKILNVAALTINCLLCHRLCMISAGTSIIPRKTEEKLAWKRWQMEQRGRQGAWVKNSPNNAILCVTCHRVKHCSLARSAQTRLVCPALDKNMWFGLSWEQPISSHMISWNPMNQRHKGYLGIKIKLATYTACFKVLFPDDCKVNTKGILLLNGALVFCFHITGVKLIHLYSTKDHSGVNVRPCITLQV